MRQRVEGGGHIRQSKSENPSTTTVSDGRAAIAASQRNIKPFGCVERHRILPLFVELYCGATLLSSEQARTKQSKSVTL